MCVHKRLREQVAMGHTVLLCRSKSFIRGPYPILVLTMVMGMVMGRSSRADAQSDAKNYKGPTTSRENAIGKYLSFSHTFF